MCVHSDECMRVYTRALVSVLMLKKPKEYTPLRLPRHPPAATGSYASRHQPAALPLTKRARTQPGPTPGGKWRHTKKFPPSASFTSRLPPPGSSVSSRRPLPPVLAHGFHPAPPKIRSNQRHYPCPGRRLPRHFRVNVSAWILWLPRRRSIRRAAAQL